MMIRLTDFKTKEDLYIQAGLRVVSIVPLENGSTSVQVVLGRDSSGFGYGGDRMGYYTVVESSVVVARKFGQL